MTSRKSTGMTFTKKRTHTHIALPAIFALWRIRTALSALLLSSMFLSCHARISVIHIKSEHICFVSYYQIFFSLFVLLGSGTRDLLQDGVWTVLLLLQANVTGAIHTGR